MIAIDVHDLESKIVDERNTNFLCDIENFQNKYSSTPSGQQQEFTLMENFAILH